MLGPVRCTEPAPDLAASLALQWFYRYFNEQTDLEFESEFELREKGQA
jgi:hypothetical protein